MRGAGIEGKRDWEIALSGRLGGVALSLFALSGRLGGVALSLFALSGRLGGVALSLLALWGYVGWGRELRLGEAEVGMARPSTYYAASGGHSGAITSARDVAGSVVYSFAMARVGAIDVAGGKGEIGKAIEPPDEFNVDWARFSAGFATQAAAKGGYVFYVNATNAAERVVAARAGEFELTWPDRDGHEVTLSYSVALPKSQTKYRLFWTSAPVNGPAVDIPANHGVRLYGDTNLFWQASSTNALGTPIYEYGVNYDSESHSCQAYARQRADGTYEGPRGMFVVAYYDNGDCANYLGCSVVEVSGPDIVYLTAKVGEEVRPLSEEYDPEAARFKAVLQSEKNGTDDPRAPYFYVQTPVSGSSHKKDNLVFAISETVPGEAGAKRAEIFWEAADEFDVYWPMEESCYHLTWPECPTVVLGANGTAGTPGVTLPSNYTASLLDWREPKDVASMSGSELALRKPGRFTLKLTTLEADDFVLMPLKVARSDDARAFPIAKPIKWKVGQEVTAEVWRNHPGFVHEAASPGRNWNEGIVSNAIYFVNTADTADYDAEVWWTRSYTKDGLDGEVVFPCMVERFKAEWPGEREVQDIVFASGKGSSAGGFACAGRALRLAGTNANAKVSIPLTGLANGESALAMWVNPGPGEGGRGAVETQAGKALRVASGMFSATLTVERAATAEAAAECCLEFVGEKHRFSLAADEWSMLMVVNATNATTMYCNGREVARRERLMDAEETKQTLTIELGDESEAAAGITIGRLHAWGGSFDEATVMAYATNGLAISQEKALMKIDFETAEEVGGTTYVSESESRRYLTGSGVRIVKPGAPTWIDGRLYATNGVVPTAYVQNDSGAIGYNPNEEHAIMLEEGGYYSLYALRSDMNDDRHPPYALAQYEENGKAAMRAYRVCMTNECHRWPQLNVTAGERLVLPHPLDSMPSGTARGTTFETCGGGEDAAVLFRDRTGRDWARRDGKAKLSVRYIGEEGFACTGGEPSKRDLTGEEIPLIDLEHAYVWPTRGESGAKAMAATTVGGISRETLLGYAPTAIELDAAWPEVGGVPEMAIAQSLSKAEGALPDVYDMKTCAIAYPYRAEDRVVKLIDPTCRKERAIPLTSDFASEYGFTLGTTGNCHYRNNRYYFADMPASVSDRLFVDPTGSKAKLVLIGDYHESEAGTSYLRVNSLSQADCNKIRNVFEGVKEKQSDDEKRSKLDTLIAAVEEIAGRDDVEPTTQVYAGASDGYGYVTNDYQAADHYALVATGEGNGWVTIVENDGPEAGALPVTVHTLYVGTNLYSGKLVTLTDPNNVLSEQVSALYTAPLGRTADEFDFVWYYADEPSDGHVPSVPGEATAHPGDEGETAWNASAAAQSGKGAACIDTVSDANTGAVQMKELVNRYWTMHYRARQGAKAARIVGERWSGWCAPTLAEGWLQRVMNAITPFAQRLTDFYSNKTEFNNTMLKQIGKPWQGDVALNNENLTEVGLEEFYRTILNRAEAMSIAQGEGTTVNDTSEAVNKQLVEATARLADMQMTLGAEAYADAKNPLIASSDGSENAGAVFCFANQVPTLLDEELALLRGRTKSVSPSMKEFPFYNRLMWNFTKGVTQGEVAYVNNYNIKGADGKIDAEAAAKMYPQGHGDAYGYYLSTVKSYYRLLRNPNFWWGEPAMTAMVVADHVVNVNYQEEDKFAEAAYDLAKIGAEVVELTARKQWSEIVKWLNGEMVKSGDGEMVKSGDGEMVKLGSGYFDDPAVGLKAEDVALPQAFGYGEWSCRAGYGAFVNWAVANSILPNAAQATNYFEDASIATVTRTSSASLRPLADTVKTIEATVNRVDAGLNPLGLSNDAIPFDISAAEFEQTLGGEGTKTHYEQIRERAQTALDNAYAVLDYANRYSAKLRETENDEEEAKDDAEEMEASYEKQLIEIYGRPYADDIGAGKTYEQGYSGPDLYHYMYVDLSEYGLDSVDDYQSHVEVTVVPNPTFVTGWREEFIANNASSVTNYLKSVTYIDTMISYELTGEGFVAKPKDFVGRRASEGLIQQAYRELLTAYVNAKSAREKYEQACEEYDGKLESVAGNFRQQDHYYSNLASVYSKQRDLMKAKTAIDIIKDYVSIATILTTGSVMKELMQLAQTIGGVDSCDTLFFDVDEKSPTADDDMRELHSAAANAFKTSSIRGQLTAIVNSAFTPTKGMTKEEKKSYEETVMGMKGAVKMMKLTDDKGNLLSDGEIETAVNSMLTKIYNNPKSKYAKDDPNHEKTEDFVKQHSGTILTAANSAFSRGSTVKVVKSSVQEIGSDSVTTRVVLKDGSVMQMKSSIQGLKDAIAALEADPDRAVNNALDKISLYEARQKVEAIAKEHGLEVGNILKEVDTPTLSEITLGTATTIPATTVAKQSKFAVSKIALGTALAMLGAELPALQSLILEFKLANTDMSELMAGYSSFNNQNTAVKDIVAKGDALTDAAMDYLELHSALLDATQTYLSVLETGNTLQMMRATSRERQASIATEARYRDMYARVARNVAISKYATAFDTAQRQVFQLAKVYAYETGDYNSFADASVVTRALGTEGVISDGSSVTDSGLWDVVNRMDANFGQLKGQLGLNAGDGSETWFSMRWSNFRINGGAAGDDAWRNELGKHWRDDIFTDVDVARLCQRPAGSIGAEPGFVIPFESAIYLDRNFFNKPLLNGDKSFSSSDCTVKIRSVGVDFAGYENLVSREGLAAEPNVYLVPVGTDYMRASSNGVHVVREFNVVDQVLPIPYAFTDDEIASEDWVAGLNSNVTTRRHSTLAACSGVASNRLVGRSVWNGRWLLVIPARSLHSNPERAKSAFLNGVSGSAGVSDIKIGIKAYSRSGN